MQLSPLNFRGLIDTMGIVLVGRDAKIKERTRLEPIACWRCPECDHVHRDEDDAAECCADVGVKCAPTSMGCPVCAQECDSHRDASDCCLWKDLDAATRHRIADAVEAGSTWTEKLGITSVALSSS